MPGAVSGPRNHHGRGGQKISGPVAVNVDREPWGRLLEEATWAGAGEAKPGFAPLPTSKVSACQPTSAWILTQPRARSVSIQLSDLGLILGLSLGPGPRAKKLHPTKGLPQCLHLEPWFKSCLCHLQPVTLNLSLFLFIIVKPVWSPLPRGQCTQSAGHTVGIQQAVAVNTVTVLDIQSGDLDSNPALPLVPAPRDLGTLSGFSEPQVSHLDEKSDVTVLSSACSEMKWQDVERHGEPPPGSWPGWIQMSSPPRSRALPA